MTIALAEHFIIFWNFNVVSLTIVLDLNNLSKNRAQGSKEMRKEGWGVDKLR